MSNLILEKNRDNWLKLAEKVIKALKELDESVSDSQNGLIHGQDRMKVLQRISNASLKALLASEALKEELDTEVFKGEKFARKCSATGEPMNEGYVVADGEFYFKYQKDLIKHLREVNTDGAWGEANLDILHAAYKDEYCYYTQWEELDEDEDYYDLNGNLIDGTPQLK